LGVDFKIQDFNGFFLGKEGTSEYTPDDCLLISDEYIHDQNDCRCKVGYKQLIVMRDGSIISCYLIHGIVGNMIEGTYKLNYYVSLLKKSLV